MRWQELTCDSERHAADAEMLPGVLNIGLHGPAEHQIRPEALGRHLQTRVHVFNGPVQQSASLQASKHLHTERSCGKPQLQTKK